MTQSHINNLISHSDDFAKLESDLKHTRCSGCGNYGILNATMRAIALQWYQPHEVIFVYDVWCSGNWSDKIMVNSIHGLHGRSMPLASGVHCAMPTTPVLAMAGDGATMSEWVNHLIHTARNNFNITFLLHNNHNYGLTTGQASATTPKGCHHKATVWETSATPLVPAQLVLSSGWTFVARWYSWDVEQLTDLIIKGMSHQWFSFIEIMQLCPTYSKVTPEHRYDQRIYKLSDRDDYDHTDRKLAWETADNFENIATGVLYRDTDSQDYYSLQPQRKDKKTTPMEEVAQVDISGLLKSFVV